MTIQLLQTLIQLNAIQQIHSNRVTSTPTYANAFASILASQLTNSTLSNSLFGEKAGSFSFPIPEVHVHTKTAAVSNQNISSSKNLGTKNDFQSIIESAAKKYGVDPKLIKAVI